MDPRLTWPFGWCRVRITQTRLALISSHDVAASVNSHIHAASQAHPKDHSMQMHLQYLSTFVPLQALLKSLRGRIPGLTWPFVQALPTRQRYPLSCPWYPQIFLAVLRSTALKREQRVCCTLHLRRLNAPFRKDYGPEALMLFD